MIVYLAGAINGTDDSAQAWRREARDLLVGCLVLDPLDRDYRGLEAATDPAEIVSQDLASIASCQIVLARVCAPSWGTAQELVYARMLGKQVIGWGTKAQSASPWLRYHCAAILPDLGAACLEVLSRAAAT